MKKTKKDLIKKQDLIYNYVLKIPFSRVVSYSELSRIIFEKHKIKIHPRVIALVLSKNKDLNKIPCYKVNYFNGFVSGYALGIKEKIKRLKSERINVNYDPKTDKYKIPMRFYYYFDKNKLN